MLAWSSFVSSRELVGYSCPLGKSYFRRFRRNKMSNKRRMGSWAYMYWGIAWSQYNSLAVRIYLFVWGNIGIPIPSANRPTFPTASIRLCFWNVGGFDFPATP